jgi:hypothetical protein
MDQPTNTQQPMECKVCQKVTMADGSSVWVCQECGEEHQPVTVVPQATAVAQPVTPVQPLTPVQPVPAVEVPAVETDQTLQAEVTAAAQALTPKAS